MSKYISIIALTICSLLWAVFVYFAAITHLPYSPISPSFQKNVSLQLLFPQGWPFFTKNPRDEWHFIYEHTNGKWERYGYAPNFQVKNAWGLKRTGRAQGIEYGYLCQKFLKDTILWQISENGDIFPAMSTDSIPTITFNNPYPKPLICGEVYFVRQEVLPWAWRHSKKPYTMPAKFVKLMVKCK